MKKFTLFLSILTTASYPSEATHDSIKIALFAPALEKDNHIYKGTIEVRNKNLRVLFPPCDSFEQREKYIQLMGTLLYRRNIKHVLNCTTTKGIVISTQATYQFKNDAITGHQKYHYVDTQILEDLTNFLATKNSKIKNNFHIVADKQWESLQPENPSGLRLLIYFNDDGNAACIDPENNCLGFDQIDVPNRIKREDFKKLKDALTKLYNHGGASQHPLELDVHNLRLICTMLKPQD
jgi:hypothetical protein